MQTHCRKGNSLNTVKNTVLKGAVAIGMVGASFFTMGMYDGPQRLVEDTYVVQQGDTLWSIGEEYLKKNTGGRRYILEFIEGIREINPELHESKSVVYPGQKIRINYWVNDRLENKTGQYVITMDE